MKIHSICAGSRFTGGSGRSPSGHPHFRRRIMSYFALHRRNFIPFFHGASHIKPPSGISPVTLYLPYFSPPDPHFTLLRRWRARRRTGRRGRRGPVFIFLVELHLPHVLLVALVCGDLLRVRRRLGGHADERRCGFRRAREVGCATRSPGRSHFDGLMLRATTGLSAGLIVLLYAPVVLPIEKCTAF